MRPLQVAGFTPFTTIDFPLVSAACVVFCQGCPWRCPFCQNRDLQLFTSASLEWESILEKIAERRNFLDGVVFSGGEALVQEALPEALAAVRNLGLKTALHTAGPWPERLAEVLPLLDWVGLDIKTCFDEYDALTGVANSGRKAEQSLGVLLKRGNNVSFECRTTVDPDFVTPVQVLRIVQDLSQRGVQHYALQECLDDDRNPRSSPCFEAEFLASLREIMPGLIVRRA